VLIAGLVVNLAANMVLIPQFGLNGAAAASTISYTFTAAAVVFVYGRLSGQGLRETLIVRRSDLTRARAELRELVNRLRLPQGPA
jgi:O-antigen/teichoic acid export membrane protein